MIFSPSNLIYLSHTSFMVMLMFLACSGTDSSPLRLWKYGLLWKKSDLITVKLRASSKQTTQTGTSVYQQNKSTDHYPEFSQNMNERISHRRSRDLTVVTERIKRRNTLREPEMFLSEERKTGDRKWCPKRCCCEDVADLIWRLSERGEYLMLYMKCQQVLWPPEPWQGWLNV